MANRLTSLLAMMILSTIFLVQFQFDLEAFSPKPQMAHPKTPGSEMALATRCKGRLSESDKNDCTVNQVQAFCSVPTLRDNKGSKQKNSRIDLLHQCKGENYDAFAKEMHKYANDIPTHGDSWGRRAFGLPSNKMILVLGNTDMQQLAHTLACQQIDEQESKITSIHAPLSETHSAQIITFANNSTMVIVSDDKIAEKPPKNIAKTIEDETGIALRQYDGMIWGLFHNCDPNAAPCPNTTVPLFDAAVNEFQGPMLFIGPMSDLRVPEAYAIRDNIREYKADGRRNLWFIMGRRYISKIRLEGAFVHGEEDADNQPKTGKYGHRCTGAQGSHADLIAFDMTEFLYNSLFYAHN